MPTPPLAEHPPRRRPRARPKPQYAQPVSLTLPHLPDALVGRRVLHLSDFHIRRPRPWYRRLADMVACESVDLVFLTGDYMTFPGDEKHALRVMGEVIEALRPRIEGGIFASFGNHDYPLFRRLAPRWITGANWLVNGAAIRPDLDLTIIGTSTPCDMIEGVSEARRIEREHGLNPDHPELAKRHYRIMLGHEPTVLLSAAEFGIEWTVAGHTHGGQFRLGPRVAIHTSCDLPPRFASGLLRCRDSICTVSRGLGETFFDVRFFCPAQMLRYELARGPLPGNPDRSYETITCIDWW